MANYCSDSHFKCWAQLLLQQEDKKTWNWCLEFLQQFYDGFYIQPSGLYCVRIFLAYLFQCLVGFKNDIAPKLEELSANASIVVQKVIQIAYSGIMLGMVLEVMIGLGYFRYWLQVWDVVTWLLLSKFSLHQRIDLKAWKVTSGMIGLWRNLQYFL